jgi:hypothetical protein
LSELNFGIDLAAMRRKNKRFGNQPGSRAAIRYTGERGFGLAGIRPIIRNKIFFPTKKKLFLNLTEYRAVK